MIFRSLQQNGCECCHLQFTDKETEAQRSLGLCHSVQDLEEHGETGKFNAHRSRQAPEGRVTHIRISWQGKEVTGLWSLGFWSQRKGHWVLVPCVISHLLSCCLQSYFSLWPLWEIYLTEISVPDSIIPDSIPYYIGWTLLFSIPFYSMFFKGIVKHLVNWFWNSLKFLRNDLKITYTSELN